MARPGFLAGTVPLYAVGVAVAVDAGGSVRPRSAVAGLALVLAAGLATHYANEYHDRETDRVTTRPTRLSGGSRVLPRGLVPPTTARRAAHVALLGFIGIAVAIGLALDPGPWFPPLAAAGILGGWCYSSPPVALSSRGLGEADVGLVAGLVVPAMGALLGTGGRAGAAVGSGGLLSVCAPLAVLGFATSLSTGLPDVEPDRATGKRTLAVRLGVRRASSLHAGSLLAGWLLLAWSLLAIDPVVGAVALLPTVPLLASHARRAPAAARGDLDAAEDLGMVSVLATGWAAVSTAGLLLLA